MGQDCLQASGSSSRVDSRGAPMQRTPQEERVQRIVGRMDEGEVSVGTSRHSDVLQASGE